MQTQLEQLREFPVNAGQLLNATMHARGKFAVGVCDRFVELIYSRSVDFNHTKPLVFKETRPTISAYSGAARGWWDSRMGDIYGVGHHKEKLAFRRGRERENNLTRVGAIAGLEMPVNRTQCPRTH